MGKSFGKNYFEAVVFLFTTSFFATNVYLCTKND